MQARRGYHLPVLLLLLLTCGQGADALLCSCNDHRACIPLPSANDETFTSIINDTSSLRRIRTTHVCSIGPEGQCYASKTYEADTEVGKGHGKVYTSYGCISSEEHRTLHCHSNLVPHFQPKAIACCNNTDLCNADLEPSFNNVDVDEYLERIGVAQEPLGNHHPVAHQVVLLVCICISVVVVTLLLLFLWYHYRHQLLRQLQDKTPALAILPEDSRELLPGFGLSGGSGGANGGVSMTSGSGSGPPILVQRTISKQIQLMERIGRGRFGEVWKGQWRGDDLAVKIFNTSEEASWYRESQLYQSVTLRHDNVLGFIASDVKGSGAFTQLFLITEYHPLGSLLHYLCASTPLSLVCLFRMAHSLATGVNYLHTEIAGSRGKPAVAHRDLKSTNVLVKVDLTLCVADLGLAVCQPDGNCAASLPPLPAPPPQRVGTRRYMAPELLERDFTAAAGLPTPPLSFEAYKKADMYALGLVLWEICQRAQWHGSAAHVPCHRLPYAELFDDAAEAPSLAELVHAVCAEGRRPTLPPVEPASSSSGRQFAETARLLGELWSADPDARLPALRVKKILANLAGVRSCAAAAVDADAPAAAPSPPSPCAAAASDANV